MFKFDFNIKETMELVGKKVVVTCIDGQEVTGKVVGFTSKYVFNNKTLLEVSPNFLD